jgi:hypothetical protein
MVWVDDVVTFLELDQWNINLDVGDNRLVDYLLC